MAVQKAFTILRRAARACIAPIPSPWINAACANRATLNGASLNGSTLHDAPLNSGLSDASFASCADERAREVWKEYHAEQRIKRLDRAPAEAMQAFVKLLLRERGYRDVVSVASRDDKRVQLVLPLCDGRRLAIQVRKGSGALGSHAVEELISALAENGCHCGFVVCSSGFTRGAKERARQDGRIRLLDRRWLVEMTRKYLADDLPPFEPAAYERLMRSWAGRKALRQTSPCRDVPFESIRFRTAN